MNRPIVLGVAALLLFALGVIAANTRIAQGVIPVTAYEADVNKDTRVNIADIGLVASKYGQPVPTATATAMPPPSATPTATPVPGTHDVAVSLSFDDVPLTNGSPVTYLVVARNIGDTDTNTNGGLVLMAPPDFQRLSVSAPTGFLCQANQYGPGSVSCGLSSVRQNRYVWMAVTGYYTDYSSATPVVLEASYTLNNDSNPDNNVTTRTQLRQLCGAVCPNPE